MRGTSFFRYFILWGNQLWNYPYFKGYNISMKGKRIETPTDQS